MTGLWTTYLGQLKKAKFNPINVFPKAFEPTLFVYVMRKRGNDIVAPSEGLLSDWKNKKISWIEYAHHYHDWVGCREAVVWMKEVGERAKKANVVLVCYEKDSAHCHRTLLAQAVAKWSGCTYNGEIEEESHLRRAFT